MAAPNFLAGGNITPSRIVTNVGQADFTVIQSTSDTIGSVGVSQEGTWLAPGTLGATSFAAISGQEIRVHGIGDECLLECGAAVSAGFLIKPDSLGRGINVTGSETYATHYVGRALESASSSAFLFRCLVNPGVLANDTNQS